MMATKRRILIAVALAAVVTTALAIALANSAINAAVAKGVKSPRELSIIIIENGNTILRNLNKVLVSGTISTRNTKALTSILKYDTILHLNHVKKKPKIIIINLLDRRVLDELISCRKCVSVLQDFASKGVYVLLVSNDLKRLRDVCEKFSPPLSYINPAGLTIVKRLSNGTTTTITEKIIVITGRAYKKIGQRMIPVDITITSHYNNYNDMDKAIAQALKGALRFVMNLEFNSSQKR